MKASLVRPLLLVLFGAMNLSPGHAQQKLAQTGFKFLNVGTDSRVCALAGGMSAAEGYASSVFFNPAGMARLTNDVSLSAGKTLWFAEIEYSYASVAFPLLGGDWGVLALSIQGVDYGDFTETILGPGGTSYIELGKFSPSAYAVGIGYARALNEKLAIGGNVKFAKQFLANAIVEYSSQNSKRVDFTADVAAFDFGVLYKTGFKSLNFGMAVRNFSQELRYKEESFQLPLVFRIGLSMDLIDLVDVDKQQHSVMVVVDAEHPRDFPEQIRLGAEYTIMKLVALRLGYVSGADEEGLTYGVGFVRELEEINLGVDYAYTPFGILGNVHRFSVQLSL